MILDTLQLRTINTIAVVQQGTALRERGYLTTYEYTFELTTGTLHVRVVVLYEVLTAVPGRDTAACTANLMYVLVSYV